MNVFISHIHEEAAIAEAVKRQLHENFGEQVDVFLAEEIPLGKNWFEQIRNALVNADLVLVIFSPYSVDRPWVNIEAGYSVMAEKIVIPICCLGVTPGKLPVVYGLLQAVVADRKADALRLLEAIASYTEAKKLLTDKELALENWLSDIRSSISESANYSPSQGTPPVVWVIGCPVVVLGSLRSENGVRRIFQDAIGKIPEAAILIGGNERGRTPEEVEKALQAKTPVLPLRFTGGFATNCESSFDVSLAESVEAVQGMHNRMDTLAQAVIDLLRKQVALQRQKLQ